MCAVVCMHEHSHTVRISSSYLTCLTYQHDLKTIALLSAPALFSHSEASLTNNASTDRRGYWRCPLPKCSTCPSSSQLKQPGVGFALEMDSGAAAIRWHNGTVQPVIQIQGSPSYVKLLMNLSYTTPQTRFPDNIPTTHGKVRYVLGRLQRIRNKLVRVPANDQTAVLADMLNDMKIAVENALPHKFRVTHAVVTSPDSIRLTAEEIGDVLDFLHITNLMAAPDELFSASAAYAGLGNGLCKTYSDPYTCAEEEHFDLPFERILVVGFSDAALSMTLKGMRSYTSTGADAAFIDLELGYADAASDTDVQQLYAKIGARMREFVQEYRFKVTKILLTGTRVGDGRFKQTLKDALAVSVAPQALTQTSPNEQAEELLHVFATAQGAAEVAKRRLEGPVRCHWKSTCEFLQTVQASGREKDGMEL